jgi:DNA-binding transcriptional regulator YbjK
MAIRPDFHRARGQVRRDALVRAAITVISKRGISGTTHRAVAAEAGFPPATTSYFFASIDELIEEAMTLVVAEQVEQLDLMTEVIAQSGGSADELAELIAQAMTEFPDAVAITQYDAYLEAARTPAFRKMAADAIAAFERLATEALIVAGATQPIEGARAFVALADGFALQRIALPHDDAKHTAQVRDAMRSLFIAYAMSETERRSWVKRLSRRRPAKRATKRVA